MRGTVRVRAEEDDFVRLERLRHLACKPADQPHANIGPTIPSGEPSVGIGGGLHEVILRSVPLGAKQVSTGPASPRRSVCALGDDLIMILQTSFLHRRLGS